MDPASASSSRPFTRPLLAAALASLALAAAAGAAELDTVFTGDLAIPAEAVHHPSGIVSLVLEEGDGLVHADGNDMVSLQVIGRDAAGGVFQDTYGDKPMALELSRTFAAFRESVTAMVTGERRRVWVPAELSPDVPTAPSGAVVFDIELLAIKFLPNPPAELAPPADAERTAWGTFTRRVAEGSGGERPGDDAAVLVDYVGWDEEGNAFDASYRRLRPTLFPLAKVMPAFADCVQRMVEGEERLCWIPAEVAQGRWPKAPQGSDLLFHLKLIAIGDGSVFDQPAAPGSATPDGDRG